MVQDGKQSLPSQETYEIQSIEYHLAYRPKAESLGVFHDGVSADSLQFSWPFYFFLVDHMVASFEPGILFKTDKKVNSEKAN